MKKITLILTAMLVFIAALSVNANAATKYTVTVYSGLQGHFTGADTTYEGKVWSREYKPGEIVDIDLDSLGFVPDNDKYYVRGLRITGHDNDKTTGELNLHFTVSADVSYEIAYGMKGSLVPFTISYVDESGRHIRDDDTYYGMPGDKPVAAYRYVNGYRPKVRTLGKTLSEDSSENVFVFEYREISDKGSETTEETGSTSATSSNSADTDTASTSRNDNPESAAAEGSEGSGAEETIGDDSDIKEYEDLDERFAGDLFGIIRDNALVSSSVLLVVAAAALILLLRKIRNKR